MVSAEAVASTAQSVLLLGSYIALGPAVSLLAFRRRDHLWPVALVPLGGVAILGRLGGTSTAAALVSFFVMQILGRIVGLSLFFASLSIDPVPGQGAGVLLGLALMWATSTLVSAAFLAGLWSRARGAVGPGRRWVWMASLPVTGAVGAIYVALRAPSQLPPVEPKARPLGSGVAQAVRWPRA